MSTQEAHESPPRLASIVGASVMAMQGRLLNDVPSARGLAATLRRGVGRLPQEAPEVWSAVTEEILRDFPEKWLRTDAPSPQELAAYTALVHWASHQQSIRKPMHVHSDDYRRDFGRAAGELAARRSLETVKRRFDALMLSRTAGSRLQHIRSLTQLLRSEEIPLDYGVLAQDLTDLSYPASRGNVLLRWGRSFNSGYFYSTRSNA
ncbi:hypothetical protein GCM10027417_20790 [Glutamicibacter endophyticus]